ncbi:hypothetical protein ACWEK5_13135 [Rhodococcus koreensis]
MTIPKTFEYAARVEPRLRVLETTAHRLRPLLDSGAVGVTLAWHGILKPHARLLVGEQRGAPTQARDLCDVQSNPLGVVSGTEILAMEVPEQSAPESETEAWLRTYKAFDVVTDHLLTVAGIKNDTE